MIQKLQRKIDVHHIQIENIPDSLIITARYNSIQRCLTNILDNAMRYAENAYLTLEKRNKHIIIYIEDDGPGIPQQSYNDVFRAFYRLENSRNPETGGSGLGLAIARTITHQHGGEIEMEQSAKYFGLKVKIILPV